MYVIFKKVRKGIYAQSAQSSFSMGVFWGTLPFQPLDVALQHQRLRPKQMCLSNLFQGNTGGVIEHKFVLSFIQTYFPISLFFGFISLRMSCSSIRGFFLNWVSFLVTLPCSGFWEWVNCVSIWSFVIVLFCQCAWMLMLRMLWSSVLCWFSGPGYLNPYSTLICCFVLHSESSQTKNRLI